MAIPSMSTAGSGTRDATLDQLFWTTPGFDLHGVHHGIGERHSMSFVVGVVRVAASGGGLDELEVFEQGGMGRGPAEHLAGVCRC